MDEYRLTMIAIICFALLKSVTSQCQVAQVCVTDLSVEDCAPGQILAPNLNIFGCCPGCQNSPGNLFFLCQFINFYTSLFLSSVKIFSYEQIL